MAAGQLVPRRYAPVSQAATAPRLRRMNPPATATTVSATTQPNTRHPKDFILDPIEERSAIGLVARSRIVVVASSIALTARLSTCRNRRSLGGACGAG